MRRKSWGVALASGLPPDRNPYPPRSGDQESPPVAAPPEWFRRYWPIVLTVGGFFLGGFLFYLDIRSDENVAAIPAVIYTLMMGYLPISWAAGLLGGRK